MYVLRCRDGSLYTGVARNLERRLAQHRAGLGSAYVRSRLPVTVVRKEWQDTWSRALKREHAIKRLPPGRKRLLCGLNPRKA